MKYSDSYLRRARLVSGLVTFSGCTIPEITQATGQSCLAIPPWVDAMSTENGFGLKVKRDELPRDGTHGTRMPN